MIWAPIYPKPSLLALHPNWKQIIIKPDRAAGMIPEAPKDASQKSADGSVFRLVPLSSGLPRGHPVALNGWNEFLEKSEGLAAMG
jgi:hypothetical protein